MTQTGTLGASRIVEGSLETLKLMALLIVGVMLMVGDHRSDWLAHMRYLAESAMTPVYRVVSLPSRLIDAGHDVFASRSHLARENRRLVEENLLLQARIDRLTTLQHENLRLRELLGATRGYQVDVRLTTILDIDLDPFRHRVVIDQGERQGVHAGQALIDGGGVFGQVIRPAANQATALLITDPDHAVPVQVVRSGLRLLAFGTGERDRLELRNIPQSGDIREGDQLITSGIGGTFPAGFAVGTVSALADDPVRQFRIGSLVPSAALDRSGVLLLVWTRVVDPEPAGPLPQADAVAAPGGGGG